MTKNAKIILAAIFLAAAFLRLYKLAEVPVSLFGDELDVGYHAYSILKTGRDYSGNFMPLHFHSLAEWRTPLYLYSSVPTVALFGISPLGVRLPAAIFGILTIPVFYFLVREIRNKYLEIRNSNLEIIAAALLALSPWHIQYSRAAFEVTQMIFFLLLGLWLFLKSTREKGKHLWISAASFALLPWIYSTSKLFAPMLLAFLFLVWFKQIIKFPKKQIIYAVIALAVVGSPITISTVFGGGSARFSYIGVFTDPTIETEVGAARQHDANFRGETTAGLQPTVVDRAFHNKVVFWTENIMRNYFQTFSGTFLFDQGDPNPRHSIGRVGQFYKIESVALIIGLAMFFQKSVDRRLKCLVAFWILVGALPAAITRDGGNHATRLILILPPLILLIAYGLVSIPKKLHSLLPSYSLHAAYLGWLILGFVFYQHNFWMHNPWHSERWWHAGWSEAIQSVKALENDYEVVGITSSDEPPWIFFAAHYEYDPADWQANFPIGNDIETKEFGKVSHIGKFRFGSPSGGLYDWGKVLSNKTLYLASAKEVNVNLIREPERTPHDLKLIKSIAYPSGEPAFYLFTGGMQTEQ